MIVWTKKVYYSENIKEKKRGKIRAKLEKGKWMHDIFVIALASNPANLLDIYSAGELCFPHYKRLEIHACGVAKSKAEAEELVRVIIEEMYGQTADFDVKAFLETDFGA